MNHIATDLGNRKESQVFKDLVLGEIYGAGSDGVYYAGADGETFNFSVSGAKLVKGGGGNDTFIFAAGGLTAATTIVGAGRIANDTVSFSTSGAILSSAWRHVSGIETINLMGGWNTVAVTNALVGTANGKTLTINGNSGNDTIDVSAVTNAAYHVNIDGGSGPATTIIAGAAIDTFVFDSAADSTGASYETIHGVNFNHDYFDLGGPAGTIQRIDPAVTQGTLSTSTFDANLETFLSPSKLGANDAVLFTAPPGTLAGQTFLVVDVNGVAGYQRNDDLVIHLINKTGALTAKNFI